MKSRTQALGKEFERKLRDARREVWRTVVRTKEELATLDAHQAGASSEDDAGTVAAAGVLARLDTSERRLLDEIDAAQARLAAGTFGTCERCGKSIPLARLRALPAARLCVACERAAERTASAERAGADRAARGSP
jgi:DnaK suppressor protein